MRIAGAAIVILALAACASSARHYDWPSVPIERPEGGVQYLPPPDAGAAPDNGCPPLATDCNGGA